MKFKQYGELQKWNAVYEAILITSEKQGLIKEIPIFGHFCKIAQATKSVSDQLFMFKLSKFIEDVNKVSNQELTTITNALKYEPNEELAEKLLLTIDNLNEADKSKYIAQALYLYSNVELTKSDFLRSLDLIQKMYIGDLNNLVRVGWISSFITSEELESMDLVSLIGTPLIKVQNINQEDLKRDGRIDEIGVTKYEETNFGGTFIKVLHNKPPYSVLQKQLMFERKQLFRFN
ncbi:hypothetical protein [Paraglaciecola sp. MB-3u-78]|uniref:hypothetical protein n=1 Tax=Paraglaciecola sp. MB-3u-78 TaxID=2058332 RepID=UPI000C34201E|nr:hypothetical protein [Paraglaciecola sp. MB-3u-78]PKG95981.1 hypothetical protein CXF95_25275 [Paraglaciecola sp. MB-3u-78]